MKRKTVTLTGANGESTGSVIVSKKFLAEAHRLKVAPGEILADMAEKFAESPPYDIAVPKTRRYKDSLKLRTSGEKRPNELAAA